jgi:hypothetical protein
MFDRISTSFSLAQSSWAVLKQDKQLILFPMLSSCSCFLVLLTFAAPLSVLAVTGHIPLDVNGRPPIWIYPLTFLYYFCNYFVIVFCNAALIHCALERFNGEEPTLIDGIIAAGRCLPQILAWALVAATVGVLLKMIENIHERFGAIISAILGTAWTVITFFVVPVLVAERVGPFKAVRRSIKLLSRAWGQAAIGGVGLGFFSLIIMLPGFLLFFVAMMLASATGLWMVGLGVAGLAGLYLIIGSAVCATLNTIYLSALYDFAAENHAPRGFSKRMLRAAFRSKD